MLNSWYLYELKLLYSYYIVTIYLLYTYYIYVLNKLYLCHRLLVITTILNGICIKILMLWLGFGSGGKVVVARIENPR